MKYKLIAVDMDGTLLNDDGIITPDTLDAIRQAVEHGVIFTISTGRPIQGVDKYNSALKLKSPIITYNGSMIVRSDTREVLFSQTLLLDDAMAILNYGRELNVTMCVWARNCLYCSDLNDKAYAYSALSGVEPVLLHDDYLLAKDGITKILWYADPQFNVDVQPKLCNLGFEKVTFCTSQPKFLEFFNSDVSKAVAMEKIGEIYNIRREEMIAVGDGNNDLSRIEYAGLGVAMANAPDGVKQRADYVTERTNNCGGIAEVIRKFVLD